MRRPSSGTSTLRTRSSCAGSRPESTLKPEVEGDLTVVNLLKVALKNEIEATESAARWLATTAELDVKLALARQVGDEAKHYRLIADRLQRARLRRPRVRPPGQGLRSAVPVPRRAPDHGGAGRRRPVHPRGDRRREEPAVHRVLRGARATRRRRGSTATSSSPTSTTTTSSGGDSCSALRDDAGDPGGGAARRHADARARRGAAGSGAADRGHPSRSRLLTEAEQRRCEG